MVDDGSRSSEGKIMFFGSSRGCSTKAAGLGAILQTTEGFIKLSRKEVMMSTRFSTVNRRYVGSIRD
jgi:hypothetical protein